MWTVCDRVGTVWYRMWNVLFRVWVRETRVMTAVLAAGCSVGGVLAAAGCSVWGVLAAAGSSLRKRALGQQVNLETLWNWAAAEDRQ